MIFEDLNMFPVLVRRHMSFLKPEDCEDIVNSLDRSIFKEHKSLSGNASSSFWLSKSSPYKSALDDLPVVRERIIDAINDYTNTYGMEDVLLDNSWFNIQTPGTELWSHTHPSSSVSGALYVKVDDKSSKIEFFNPNPFLAVTAIKDWTPYTFKAGWLEIKLGDLIIFPSWLKHGSHGVNESEERIVMSFNTRF